MVRLESLNPSSKPLISIQCLRAIAAWLVFFHHYVGTFYNYKSTTPVALLLTKYGDFGVDVFFVISGFVMHYSSNAKRQNGFSFAVKRIARIVPVYWFYTAVLMVAQIGFPTFSWTGYTTETLVYSLLFLPSDNPAGLGVFPFLSVGWTLNYEMLFYSIITLSMFLFRRQAFLATVGIVAVLPLFSTGWIGNWRVHEFGTGIVLSLLVTKFRMDGSSRWRLGVGVFLLATTFWILWGLRATPLLWRFQDSHFARICAATFLVAAFIFLEQLFVPSRLTRALAFMGTLSYSTYLSHIIVLGIVLHFVGAPENHAVEILTILISVTITIAVSWLSYEWIERPAYSLIGTSVNRKTSEM